MFNDNTFSSNAASNTECVNVEFKHFSERQFFSPGRNLHFWTFTEHKILNLQRCVCVWGGGGGRRLPIEFITEYYHRFPTRDPRSFFQQLICFTVNSLENKAFYYKIKIKTYKFNYVYLITRLNNVLCHTCGSHNYIIFFYGTGTGHGWCNLSYNSYDNFSARKHT